MSKEKSVIEFYVLCNRLKDLIRTGWKDWKVDRQRVESVAEHVYGTQMLAISMWSQFNYHIDIKKVLCMLAVHELEETVIGDLTYFQINDEQKVNIGHDAVCDILSKLNCGEDLKELIFEFDKMETDESVFAYQCDKLECCIQCRLYDEENCVDLNKQEGNITAQDKKVKALLQKGLTWSQMWGTIWSEKCDFDENFKSVLNYIINNKVKNI